MIFFESALDIPIPFSNFSHTRRGNGGQTFSYEVCKRTSSLASSHAEVYLDIELSSGDTVVSMPRFVGDV